MRRSAAPSSRQSLLGRPLMPKENTVSECHTVSLKGEDLPHSSTLLQPPSNSIPAVRSTATVLSLLGKLGKSNLLDEPNKDFAPGKSQSKFENQGKKQSDAVKTENLLVEKEKTAGKRIFRVVWGRPSSKKHKTWEGDGILEVGEKSATLKDEDGKVLSHASQIKTAALEEGSRLQVGSKEVELIDLLSGPQQTPVASSSKRPADEPVAKPSKSSSKRVKKQTQPLIKFTTDACDDLVLPTPSHNHQWTLNTKKLAITPVVVDSFLTRVLRPHQKEGIVFLYECVIGMRNTQYRGAILADEMGLGKTLQTIALIWTLLRQGPYGGHPVARRVLVVSPSSLVQNWKNEFDRWLGTHRLCTYIVDQKNKVTEFARLSHIPVMLISYEMLVRNYDDICKVNFDLMVCDEGHRLKNNNIRTSMLLNQLEISSRVLLTGTPVQNDLQEYYSLVNFVNPGILGSLLEFRKHFEEPIVASRQPSCSSEEHDLGEERASELNSRASCFILRRTQAVINQYLPTKTESVLFVKPTPIQKSLCKAALDWWENRVELRQMGDLTSHLGVITALKKLCNHPALIRRADVVEEDYSVPQDGLLQELSDMYNAYEGGSVAVHHSAKLNLVRQLLEELVFLQERVVLVSYFTQTLDVLAALCDEMGLAYTRLDGTTPTAQRATIVDQFNASYSKHTVFLLSARAGGVGLNLTGASRLVLFDSDWNPASDAQAMSRVWRDGQKHSVYIYRLLTSGSIEEKIFQRQLSKAGLSGAVVDPQKRSNIKFSKEELKDLFTFHDGEECITHTSLDCTCNGPGCVPSLDNLPPSHSFEEKENEVDDPDDRNCKLLFGHHPSQTDSPDLRMNQLFKWQHHSPPFDDSTLQALGLSRAHQLLVYMFVAPLSIPS